MTTEDDFDLGVNLRNCAHTTFFQRDCNTQKASVGMGSPAPTSLAQSGG